MGVRGAGGGGGRAGIGDDRGDQSVRGTRGWRAGARRRARSPGPAAGVAGRRIAVTPGRFARIASVASALPGQVVPNSYFESIVETSDQWIQERTGIKERRFAGPGESTASLSAEAAALALRRAGVGPESVDLLIIATCTPERSIPSTAAFVQARLGLSCPSFDLNAACAGYVYGLSVADAQIRAGSAERVLLVGAEVLSRVLDMTDRTTCVLFGDGAGAALLEPGQEPGVIHSLLDLDGR